MNNPVTNQVVISYIKDWSEDTTLSRSEEVTDKIKWTFRLINIPTPPAGATLAETLEVIFKYGQNDFQPVEGIRSLSVGDLVSYEGDFYKVESSGWTTLEYWSTKNLIRKNVRVIPNGTTRNERVDTPVIKALKDQSRIHPLDLAENQENDIFNNPQIR